MRWYWLEGLRTGPECLCSSWGTLWAEGAVDKHWLGSRYEASSCWVLQNRGLWVGAQSQMALGSDLKSHSGSCYPLTCLILLPHPGGDRITIIGRCVLFGKTGIVRVLGQV
jgi:hypothetical protein